MEMEIMVILKQHTLAVFDKKEMKILILWWEILKKDDIGNLGGSGD